MPVHLGSSQIFSGGSTRIVDKLTLKVTLAYNQHVPTAVSQLSRKTHLRVLHSENVPLSARSAGILRRTIEELNGTLDSPSDAGQSSAERNELRDILSNISKTLINAILFFSACGVLETHSPLDTKISHQIIAMQRVLDDFSKTNEDHTAGSQYRLLSVFFKIWSSFWRNSRRAAQIIRVNYPLTKSSNVIYALLHEISAPHFYRGILGNYVSFLDFFGAHLPLPESVCREEDSLYGVLGLVFKAGEARSVVAVRGLDIYAQDRLQKVGSEEWEEMIEKGEQMQLRVVLRVEETHSKAVLCPRCKQSVSMSSGDEQEWITCQGCGSNFNTKGPAEEKSNGSYEISSPGTQPQEASGAVFTLYSIRRVKHHSKRNAIRLPRRRPSSGALHLDPRQSITSSELNSYSRRETLRRLPHSPVLPASEPALHGARDTSKKPSAESRSSSNADMTARSTAERVAQLEPGSGRTNHRSPVSTSTSPAPGLNSLDDRTASTIAYNILSAIMDETSYRKLLQTDRRKAQRLVDISQEVLESSILDVSSRRELVVFMQRFSRSASVYPQSYRIYGAWKKARGPFVAGRGRAVYEGSYRGRDVCLKALIEDGRTTRPQLLKAFIREAILWRQLNHRNILPLYGICELDIGVCMVSPWMVMGDLQDYLRRPISPEGRLLITRDVAEGLKYLHSYDIIHGDLKGRNIMIDQAGRARIGDFMLASVEDPNIPYWEDQDRVASIGGTVPFQAPELLDKDDAVNTKTSDIYAWGCVCYEIYVGEEPYEGPTFDIVISQKLRNEMPKRPYNNSAAWKHGLTETMWMLMEETWNAHPDLRPDAHEVAKRVSEMIGNHNTSLETKDEREPWLTDVDLAPPGMRQNFNIPTVEEVEELLKLP